MIELWKDVVGYEDHFQISDHGRILRKRTNRILKSRIHDGYVVIDPKVNGEVIHFRLHILVANAFLDSPDDHILDWAAKTKYGTPYVNHKDGNKANNHSGNLEWCTGSENMCHAHSYKTEPLTSDDIIKIKSIYIPGRKGGFGCRKIAKLLGLDVNSVTNVIHKNFLCHSI